MNKLRIIRPEEENFCKEGGLRAFGLEELLRPRIAFVGAGGKTSTLLSLLEEYRSRKRKAIAATTTHMYYPEKKWFFLDGGGGEEIQEGLETNDIVWIGKSCGNGKIEEPPEPVLKTACQYSCPLLYEADGAKRLPFKTPGKNEPALLEETTIIIGVLGLDALYRKIKEVCFRPEETAAFLQKTVEERLEPADYVKVIRNSGGLSKGVTPDIRFIAILNKADEEGLVREAKAIREQLIREKIKEVFITSHKEETKEGGAYENIGERSG